MPGSLTGSPGLFLAAHTSLGSMELYRNITPLGITHHNCYNTLVLWMWIKIPEVLVQFFHNVRIHRSMECYYPMK